jgi:hypothetical protein
MNYGYGGRLHPRAIARAADVGRARVGVRRAVHPMQRQQAARAVRPAEAGGDVEQRKLVRRVVRELGGEGGGGGALDLQSGKHEPRVHVPGQREHPTRAHALSDQRSLGV